MSRHAGPPRLCAGCAQTRLGPFVRNRCRRCYLALCRAAYSGPCRGGCGRIVRMTGHTRRAGYCRVCAPAARLPYPRRVWTEPRTERLAELYEQGVRVETIALALGCTLGAVKARASVLGLHRPPGWSWKKAGP